MQNNLEKIRHSLSHLMAHAVMELFPEAKFAIGPVIDNGFYYDFDLPRPLTPQDLLKVEQKMRKLISQNIPFTRLEKSAAESKELSKNQSYKLELIEELVKNKQPITYYQSGKFTDLCAGPHVSSSKEIKADAFKLTSIAGAYWRGDEKNKMLQRIYGVAFNTKAELDEYLKMQVEAEKRDHKKIGRDLDLFSLHPETPGSAFWHPKGMILWNEIEKLGKNLRKKYGSEEIQTPQLAKKILWETSGHWDHYRESMYYFNVDKEVYCIKPMDCPFNIKIYQTKQHSYKELPVRYTEIGRVMRYEKSGELNGLLRVRAITQDDAHIFAMEKQVEKEISTLLKMVKEYYNVFNIIPEFFLATRPDDFMGEISTWNKAEENLKKSLKKEKVNYELKEKDGAFYGPKIDIHIKDALGRSWQLATIQLDFQLPQRFNVEYIDKDGNKKNPVMIHAAIFGSFERFIGILLEHTGGSLPVWLSPVQIKVITVGKTHEKYAKKLQAQFVSEGIRSELDDVNDTVGYKIRNAEKQKIPYMLVIGDKEMKSKSLNVRVRGSQQIKKMPLKSFITRVKKEIEDKK